MKSNKEKKREVILETAMRLFLEKGYSAASTNDICLAANINKPTLYYWFHSKRHLFFSLHMKHIKDTLSPFMERALSIEDPRRRLAFMIREYTKMVCLHPELRVLIHETLSIKDDYFRQIKMKWKEHYVLLRDTVSQLQSRGEAIRDFNPSWVALLVLGMITWITFWFDYSRKDRIEEIAEQVVNFTFSAISGDKVNLDMQKE